MVSDEALKKLQEQVSAWQITQRFVVQQLILDYLRAREDVRAYEATGLTPEQCENAKAIIESAFSDDTSKAERIRELLKADKDGRLVVLPCKVGDTVWIIPDGKNFCLECEVEFVNIGNLYITIVLCAKDGLREQYGVVAAAFGKTVFLTREEAEKALEAMKDE